MDLTTLLLKLPNTPCDLSINEETKDCLFFSLRLGVTDEPSNETRKSAKEMIQFVKTNYPDIEINYEFVDEWIDLTFKNKQQS